MRTAATVAVAVAVLTGCTEDGGPGPETPISVSPEPSVEILKSDPEVLATGLDAPWSLAFHEGIPLVSERDSARILELDAGGIAREAGTIEGAGGRGEGGLLGIAVQDGYLYTYFTGDGGNRIERRSITGEPGSLALDEAETILDSIPSGPVHNGGRIAFGPDGMLYATTGDAGNRDSAQDRESLSGKILRMNPDGSVPEDNPFPGTLGYSYGHRNPQGIAWDNDGVLYASEFGQNTWDELNVIEAGGNYGWPEVEGIAGEEGFIDPVQQWTPGEASPSGIAVADGTLYIANLRGERLRQVPLDNLGASAEQLAGEYGRLRDVVNAPDGSVWILTNNTDGRGRPGQDDDRVLRLDTD
ncbi:MULTISPECIES: sorbosone dehydrogenase family protein [unclassified Arthrobacter]|uniref:PQQ-dependent sugar dehydrogenase n=1 Tax=unclassified Arthrobacter TaxID=235627 RepID=UPI001D1565AD|nr:MULTISPECIES: PQQ-dependent sugar dehydrogenase [unclassified Arthrobacter]MCC3290682.1 PQQ-dependent sugar dehydrogenase [Arthrobacter sp. zg-Y1110]MCC3301930.1 PQQ-dependent sugar dehydrogenase [Arthrobacter sp. zg-Y895]UWX86102.1 PQQ-dependent sugar dehydrogenase [Arthrobacter sp. zg-Y1110]